MSRTQHPLQGEVRLPEGDFYWAVLDPVPGERVPLWESRARRSTRLAYALEGHLPVPLEEVHTAFAPLDGGRWLACTADRARLQRHVEEGAVTLAPATAPEFVGAAGTEDRVNLLTGPFEPPVVRRARQRWAVQAALIGACAWLALMIGLERRVVAERRAESAARAAAQDVYAAVLPPASAGAQPAAARLASELRTLRHTRSPGPAREGPDAAETLAQLLVRWPEGLSARTESLVVTPSSVSVTATIPDHEQAQRVASALGTAAGWRAEQPQVAKAREAVRLTARLTRTQEAAE